MPKGVIKNQDIFDDELEDTDDGTGEERETGGENLPMEDIQEISSPKVKKKGKKKNFSKFVKIKVTLPKWHQKRILKHNLKEGVKKVIWILAAVIILDLTFNLLVLVTGAIHIHNCPIEPLLPIWLIVIGVIGLLSLIITCCGGYCIRASKKEWTLPSIISTIIMVLFWLFWLSWLISGNFWVFSTWNTYNKNTSETGISELVSKTNKQYSEINITLPAEKCEKLIFDLSAGWVITLDVLILFVTLASIYALVIYKIHLRKIRNSSHT